MVGGEGDEEALGGDELGQPQHGFFMALGWEGDEQEMHHLHLLLPLISSLLIGKRFMSNRDFWRRKLVKSRMYIAVESYF